MRRPAFLIGPPDEADPAPSRAATLDWLPLERIVAPSLRAEFMFMGRGHSNDGDVICLYKHRDTREYLNIDTCGRMYRYLAGRYMRLDAESAIEASVPELLAALARRAARLPAPESSCDP